MSDIVPRKPTAEISTIGMAPSEDPTKIDWQPILDWPWQTFGDLPQSVVASLSASGLLPSNIILENFPVPSEGIVDAWIIGSNGFSLFKIIPAGTNKWSAIGGFTPFKNPTLLLNDSIKSDILPSADGKETGKGSETGIELSRALSNANVLPESLRKKLFSIKTPRHEDSHIYSYYGGVGEKFNHRVDAITVNSTSIFAIKAVQEVQNYAGESVEATKKRLSASPWSVEMVYERFA